MKGTQSLSIDFHRLPLLTHFVVGFNSIFKTGGNVDLVQPLWKTACRFLKTNNKNQNYHMTQQFDSSVYTNRNPNTNSERYMDPNIHSTISITKIWKQSKCPSTDEQIKKNGPLCTVKYYSFSFSKKKKNEILPIAITCMDPEGTVSEISQAEKDTVISLICRI